MRSMFALLLALILVPIVQDLEAQEISARGADIRVGGRMNAQYSASSVAAADNDFFFRRARLIADVTVTDLMDARVQTDFAGGKAALQDAYVRLRFSPRFRVSLGQFKRAFDVFELSSSTELSLIERDGRVEGAGDCSGVGGVCSYSRFTEKLGFAGRDQGVRIDGSNGRLSWMGSVTNGTGVNKPDENDAKSYSGRLTLALTDAVRVSGQFATHDYVDPDNRNDRGQAWGADVEYGGWRSGLHIQAAATGGDNWKNLGAGGTATTFLAMQGVASYYAPLTGARLAGIEPLVRLSFGDPDSKLDDDGGLVFTPGLMFYISGRNKIGVNFDVYAPQVGDTEYSFKLQSFLYF